ncbi:hypothetical protein BH18THE2_BH18THE2_20570 [soil metagenome]
MSKSKSNSLLLTLTMIVTSLSMTSFSQLSQAVYSQTDYEELIITENNNEQKLNQENTGSGSSTNINCGTNTITSNSPQPITTICPNVPGETPPTIDKEFATATVSNTVRMEFTSRGTAEVSCPEGTEVTGGGYDLRPEGNVQVHDVISTEENVPIENGWKATITVDAVSDEVTLLLTVYAVCGTLVNPA